MIIGTEVSGDEAGSYSKSRIQEMQRGEQHEISRSIFLSPITPNTDAKLALSEDKRRRTRIINRKLHSHQSPTVLFEIVYRCVLVEYQGPLRNSMSPNSTICNTIISHSISNHYG
jgi:hypothetical protein